MIGKLVLVENMHLEGPESPREGDMVFRRQILSPENQDRFFVERFFDQCELGIIEGASEVDVADFCPNMIVQFGDGHRHCDIIGHVGIFVQVG